MTIDEPGVTVAQATPLQQLPGRSTADLLPGTTVVVVARDDDAALHRCLTSLGAQLANPAVWEVVVVLTGQDDSVAVLDLIADRGDVRVRTVRLPWDGRARARNAGLAAARHDHVVFVDPHESVGARWLQGLLTLMAPGVVPIGHAVTVDAGPAASKPTRTTTSTSPGDTVVATELLPTHVLGLDAAFVKRDAWGGILVPTRQAQRVGYDPTLVTTRDQDTVFLVGVLAQIDGLAATTAATADIVMYRAAHPENVADPTDPTDAVDQDNVDADSNTVDGNVAHGRHEVVTAAEPVLTVIERLDGLRRAGIGLCGPGGDVLAAALSAETLKLHWLRARIVADGDRDADAALVAELDRRPIQSLPYAVLNQGLAEDLAIGYAFPPTADTSATVAGKRVRQLGNIVDVVRNPLDALRTDDESLRRISGPFTAVEHVVDTPAAFMDWATMCSFAETGLAEIAGHRSRPYRSVYSRAHWAASHVMAAQYKLANPDTRWIAEFSDPLSRDIWDKVRGSVVLHDDPVLTPIREEMARRGFAGLRSETAMEWCEWIVYGLADEVIFTNENQQSYMIGYIPHRQLAERAAEIATVRPHPTLAPAFYEMVVSDYELADGVANIGYFGNFYATRGLDSVLAAMAELEVDSPGAVHLHVFTSNRDEMDQAAATAGVGHLVTSRAYVPYLEFLNLTTRFDALLVNDAETGDTHGVNPYLPSKWSDYRGSGRGVWGIVEPDSPLSHQPLAWQSALGNMPEIEASLREIVTSVHGPV